jgi:hypothetical protein
MRGDLGGEGRQEMKSEKSNICYHCNNATTSRGVGGYDRSTGTPICYKCLETLLGVSQPKKRANAATMKSERLVAVLEA